MNPFVTVAGWTLIHFVWQGGAVVLVAASALRLARYRSANVRYLIACAGLAATLAAPLATGALLLPATPADSDDIAVLNDGPTAPAVSLPGAVRCARRAAVAGGCCGPCASRHR
jgi:hypothetical protein